MTYNILDGAKDTFDLIIDIIKETHPDYLTINEANTFAYNNQERLKILSRETNLPYSKLALSGEDDYHLAVFSKYSFKEIEAIRPLIRAGIWAVIDTPFGEISLVSTHLSPYSEDNRSPEIQLLMNSQKGYKNKVLMGDLNSLSRNDNYPKKIIKDFNKKQIKKFTKNGSLSFNVIDSILSEQYIDAAYTMKNKENTVPTESNIDDAHAEMRLDYIFISESLCPYLSSYEVIKNKKTNKASDHYPILINLIDNFSQKS